MAEQNVIKSDLIKVHNALFEIPKTYRADMRVSARIYTNDQMLEAILEDRSLLQTVNVAALPGIQKYSLAMPDIHQGYGFPIGGVAAMNINDGVISPGGIGYDINCGVRLLAANISFQDIKPYIEELATEVFNRVPSGVGRSGKYKLSLKEIDKILIGGAKKMLEQGYGFESDVEFCEESGNMAGADPRSVSEMAKKRGHDQLGTLGSGNHFLEIQYVDEIYDENAAKVFGLQEGQITIMIHCGSRGLGHQTCTDYVKSMLPKLDEWGIRLPDNELACAPFNSREGQEYLSAMASSANFAWANRHMIAHEVRESFKKIIGDSVLVKAVYDLSHNIGKIEEHIIDGILKKVIVHRKGATRAFPAYHKDVPPFYKSVGHPVLIPGTMGTASYVLVGTEKGYVETFGSSCHGAGRVMSRVKAKKTIRGSTLRQELEALGIVIRCESDPGLAEEAPSAYKDVDAVIEVVEHAQIAQKVAKLKPLAVVKGG